MPHPRKLLPAVRKHDRKPHEQIRDAGSSMPLDLGALAFRAGISPANESGHLGCVAA